MLINVYVRVQTPPIDFYKEKKTRQELLIPGSQIFPTPTYEAENENEIGYKYSHSFSSAILSVSPQRIISEGLLPHDMHGLEGEFEANPAL